MIVVADTSVLNYLIRMRRVELPPALYGRIVIAHAVRDELLASKARIEVRQWAQELAFRMSEELREAALRLSMAQ